MENEAIEYLKRFEALHLAHFDEPVDFVAGSLTHAGQIYIQKAIDKIVDYQLLVTFDFMTTDMGYGELITTHAPNLARCVENTRQNPLLSDYLKQNERNVFTAAGFAF